MLQSKYGMYFKQQETKSFPEFVKTKISHQNRPVVGPRTPQGAFFTKIVCDFILFFMIYFFMKKLLIIVHD